MLLISLTYFLSSCNANGLFKFLRDSLSDEIGRVG